MAERPSARREGEPNPLGGFANLETVLGAAEAHAGLGVWRWPLGSPRVYVSAGLAGLLDLASGAADCSARSLVRRLERKNRRTLFSALRASGAATVELTLAPQDGRPAQILSVAVHAGADGRWGICHDVTALRGVSTALAESESRWEMALASARQGVWDANVKTGEVYHSSTWRIMRGMNAGYDERDSHAEWITRVHPDDIDRVLAINAREHSGEVRNVAFEYRERRVDGRYIWIASFGKPVEWDENGLPTRIVGTDTDITERKLAEAKMARLSRRLGLALEVSELGVFEANLTTGEVYWDKRVREIYGIAEDFVVGSSYWEGTLHPDDREPAVARVWAAVESRGTYSSDFRIRRADGEYRNIHTVGIWYEDIDGQPKLLGVNWDVTDEVAAKNDLERARNLAEARNAELEATKAAIEFNALHDALTGLPNRRYLDAHLAERAAWAAETGGSVSLLHLDLDLFKQINDTLGHVAGDAMLVHVAKLMRDTVRPGDFVARVGGDEFSIVCSLPAGSTELARLAQDIIARIRRPVPYEGHFCRFGASVGIASQAGAGVDPQRLLIDADIALYRAKGHGKNRHEFFTEALQAETVNTKRVADDIQMGIEQDEFFPYFQPLLDAQTLELVGVEALARWRHPIRGVLPPAAFLKIAEDLNVVTAIDRVILEQTLDHFDHWRSIGLEVPAVSVNVSFRRLHDQQLLRSLKELRIRPGTLSFELLESIFLDELDDIVSWNIDQIREMGIDINVDDFGTGHASIISLLKLRPKRFKLDRAFLADLTTSPAQRRLVRSIIDIGKSLGIQVVGEGVEAIEQAQILRELGCDILQGFAFARPMPAEDFEHFLRTRSWRKAS